MNTIGSYSPPLRSAGNQPVGQHDPKPMGYLENLVDSTRVGARQGYDEMYEDRTLSLYDKMKNQPRFQKDGMPITIGEWCQAYPGYRHSAVTLGVVGAVCGGATGLAYGLVGRHILDGAGG